MNVNGVVGTWNGGDGHLTFQSNGGAVARGVRGICSGVLSGSGSWSFTNSLSFGNNGAVLSVHNFDTGKYLALDFRGGACTFFLINPTAPQKGTALRRLCYLNDPDDGCLPPVFRK